MTSPRRLVDLGYSRADIVEHRGEFAVRGGVVDVFPGTARRPVRLEFWGDEIESLREFVPSTQLSTDKVASADVPPVRELIPDEDSACPRPRTGTRPRRSVRRPAPAPRRRVVRGGCRVARAAAVRRDADAGLVAARWSVGRPDGRASNARPRPAGTPGRRSARRGDRVARRPGAPLARRSAGRTACRCGSPSSPKGSIWASRRGGPRRATPPRSRPACVT